MPPRQRRPRVSQYQMAGDSFRLGYRFQRHWDVAMASAFFMGELGAGVFLVAAVSAHLPGLILGLVLTGIGKPVFHLAHMGVPGKSWRAILRPDRSWISRGLIAIVVFCGAGILYTAAVALGIGGPAISALQAIAGLAAIVVMTYQGFAMAHSTAIALWSSALMPVAGLVFALTNGATLALLLRSPGEAAPPQLLPAALGALFADLIVLLSLLHGAYHGSAGARLSAQLLTSGRYAKWFHGMVVGAGILLPALALGLAAETLAGRALAAIGTLCGFYCFRVLIFKTGVYDPIMPIAPYGPR